MFRLIAGLFILVVVNICWVGGLGLGDGLTCSCIVCLIVCVVLVFGCCLWLGALLFWLDFDWCLFALRCGLLCDELFAICLGFTWIC